MPDIRYKGKFGSADGDVYQVHLIDDDYTGTATEFPLQSAMFNRGRRGIHLFTPILASSVELKGWKLTMDILDELLGAEVGRFTMEVYHAADHATIDGGGGTLYWKGVVQTDLGEDDTANVISDVQITATDGLTLLKDIPYFDTSGGSEAQYTGTPTHAVAINRCLAKIGYSMPTAWSSHWYPDVGLSSERIWQNATVDDSIFYDEDGDAASCYDVIKLFLYVYGGVMFWREGRWNIVQKSQIGASTYTVDGFDEAGLSTGTTVYGQTIDTSTGNRLKGSRVYRTAFGGAEVVYNHGNIPGLIRAGDFKDTDAAPATDFWQFGSSGGEIRSGVTGITWPDAGLNNVQDGVFVGARVNYEEVGFVDSFMYGTDNSFSAYRTAIYGSQRYLYQQGRQIEIGDRILFTGRFRIPFFDGLQSGLFNPFWAIGTNGGSEYMQSDGSWATLIGEATMQPMKEPHENGLANFAGWPSDKSGSGWVTFSFLSEAAPEAGDLILFLYGIAETNSVSLEAEGVEWDDIAVLIVDETGEVRDSLIYVGTTTRKEPDDKELVLPIGTGPRELFPGAVYWDGAYADGWTDDGVTYEDLGKKLLRTRLGYQSGRLETRFETYSGLDYELGDVLDIEGEIYFPVWVQKDLASMEDTFEAVRIAFDDSIITFGERGDDRGSYTVSNPTIGAAAPGTSGSSAIITDEGDLIYGGAGGAAKRLPASGTPRSFLIGDPNSIGGDDSIGWSEYSAPESVISGTFRVETEDGVPKDLVLDNGWAVRADDTGDYLVWPDGEYVTWPDGSRVVWPASS